MPDAFTQADRRLRIDTPLGADALLLTELRGEETLSGLFRFEAELLGQAAVDFDAIVGKPVAVHLASAAGDRHVHGIVNRFAQAGVVGDLDRYTAEIVPTLWFGTQRADCRIFQQKTVPEIVQAVLKELGVDVALRLRGTYPPWDYCVQYRESDYAFVARLLEEEGIGWFFEHHDGGHVLVLADHRNAYPATPLTPTARFMPAAGAGDEDDRVTWFRKAQAVRTGRWSVTDFDFEKPNVSLLSGAQGRDPRRLEVYDYPGGGTTRARLEGFASVRQQEEDTTRIAHDGTGFCRGFTPGHTFTLHGSGAGTVSVFDGEYLVTAVQHRASESWGVGEGNGEFGYENTFACIPAAAPYRPARRTPRPLVHGVQTALVVGPGGEEIYTDKYGRVKVQFHWDRDGKRDEHSSCWLRVSQPWAGAGWGGMAIPRIGQEVIVSFLEGDPDCPIITGRVYNAAQMPPYDLPANATQMGIKSRSSKGGGAANCNELRFEDKAGSEHVLLHAEKDQTIEVEHDEAHWVGRDRKKVIDRDEKINVKRDRTEVVDKDHSETIGANMTVNVGANLTETIALNYAETVGLAMELTVGAALAISVGGAMAETVGVSKAESVGTSSTENVGTSKSLRIGKSLAETVGEHRTVSIGKDCTETVGGRHRHEVKKDYSVQAKKIEFVADDEIAIKTGDAQIVLKKNGDVTIAGKTITVKGSGDVVLKGSKIKEN